MHAISVQAVCILTVQSILLIGVTFGQLQYQSYPSDQNYLTQQPESLTCNDLQCKVDECCVETYRSAQCVALVRDTNGQAFCARSKKCYRSSNCPTTAPCCVQALDSTFAKTNLRPQSYYDNIYAQYYGLNYRNSYSNSYGNSYGNIYGNSFTNRFGFGKANDISTESLSLKEGYCLPAASDNNACFRPVSWDSSVPLTPSCPCSSASSVCKLFLDPFPFGTCEPTIVNPSS